VRTNPLPKASPNLNGRCERFIETIKLEALRWFIIFGKRHLDYIVSEFCEYSFGSVGGFCSKHNVAIKLRY
jgi:putative transposase